MKKTLVALAALAATSAFAQSSVTLSGNLDFALGNVSGNATGTTVSTSSITASTSVINLIAEETVQGGFKITAKYGIDPRNLSNDNGAVNGSVGASNAGGMSNTFNRDEVFVGIAGGFGNLRLGSPNSIGLNVFQVASPLGTGVGSGYASTAGDYSFVRYDRSIRYDSPAFSGLTVSLLYAPGGDKAAHAASSIVPNNNRATEVGLRYSAGPLTIAYANVSLADQINAATNQVIAAGAAKTSSNMLSASYAMGATTLFAGWNDGDSRQLSAALGRTSTAYSSKGYRVGASHNVGAISLIGSYAEQKTEGASSTPKETVIGLRADYNLSKTAAAYLGFERYDTGTVYANTTATGTRQIASIGLRKSF